MIETPAITNKDELNKVLVKYREDWKELQKRKEANEPSVDHWRLNAEVQNTEASILNYLRNNDV